MKESYEHSKLVSNLLRAVALILSTMMCIVNFIACSAGNRDTINSSNNDVNNEVSNTNEAGYDSWESVLDAFLTAVENGDSNTLMSLIAPMVRDVMRDDTYSDEYDELGYCTTVNKTEFDSYDLSSLKIYDRRIISVANIHEESKEMALNDGIDAYASVEDTIMVVVMIDLEYYDVRFDYDHGECPEDEFIFIKQEGKWYLSYGGAVLFDLIDDMSWDHRS